MNGGDHFIGKLVAFDIYDFKKGMLPANFIGDGVKQMGFANTGRTVNKKGIVGLPRIFGHRHRRPMGKAVTGADYEGIEGKLGVKDRKSTRLNSSH